MSIVSKSLSTLALVAGVLAIAALSFGAGDRGTPSPGDDSLVPIVEGGRGEAGYLDGRPVPSGFALPVVIRWKPKSEAATGEAAPDGAELTVTRPIQGSVVTP